MKNPTKIFIIEDDISLIRMYTIKLKKEGFLVTSANNGAKALQQLPSINPDLILLDIMLPDISGLEILKEIKKNQTLKKIPVIVLTVLPEEIARKEVLKRGANEYLIKSELTPEILIQHIQIELKKKNI